MRKISIVLLVIAILAAFTACSVPDIQNSETKPSETQLLEYTEPSETQPAESTEPSETKQVDNSGGSGQFVELVSTYFNSLEEYERYFASREKAPNIVLYEDISQFGVFENFIDLGAFRKYMYILTDSSGYRFCVYVYHVEKPLTIEFETEKLTTKGNLVRCSDERPLILELDGIHYMYNKGGLLNVFWYENGIQIQLTGTNTSLIDYPATTDTFMGKLLNSATAPDAIKTIKAMKITEGLPKGTADADVCNMTPVS